MGKMMLKLAIAVLLLAVVIALALPVRGIERGADEQDLGVVGSDGTAGLSPFLLAEAKAKGKNLKCDDDPQICRREESGEERLRCCKKKCVNIRTDRNNCGLCSHKCRFGHGCCKGFCLNLASNRLNCGKCGNKCERGVRCRYGMCGYA